MFSIFNWKQNKLAMLICVTFGTNLYPNNNIFLGRLVALVSRIEESQNDVC